MPSKFRSSEVDSVSIKCSYLFFIHIDKWVIIDVDLLFVQQWADVWIGLNPGQQSVLDVGELRENSDIA